MKKLIFAVIGFVALSCTNPSVEEGLAGLEAALAELQLELDGIDVDQIITDVATMQDQVEEMENDVNLYVEQVEEWESQIQSILVDIAAVQEIIDNAGTKGLRNLWHLYRCGSGVHQVCKTRRRWAVSAHLKTL